MLNNANKRPKRGAGGIKDPQNTKQIIDHKFGKTNNKFTYCKSTTLSDLHCVKRDVNNYDQGRQLNRGEGMNNFEAQMGRRAITNFQSSEGGCEHFCAIFQDSMCKYGGTTMHEERP